MAIAAIRAIRGYKDDDELVGQFQQLSVRPSGWYCMKCFALLSTIGLYVSKRVSCLKQFNLLPTYIAKTTNGCLSRQCQ